MQTNNTELFRKLHITSLLDLALLVPVGYSDTTLSKELVIGRTLTVEAFVKSVQRQRDMLHVIFDLPAFNHKVSATFFHVTPYHLSTFIPNSSHYIQGKLSEYQGFLQLSQPKKINKPNCIIPKYKTVLKNSEMIGLVSSMLSYEKLINEGLTPNEANIIMMLHAPKSLDLIFEQKNFKSHIIHILKTVEAFNHFKKLSGKRIDFPATAVLNGDETKFIDSLPFILTDEQLKTIREIKSDISNIHKAAKRMIVGDVGSGKTMVILASAVMALPKKSILMAPTSLLALQLYEEAVKYLPKSMKISLVMQGKMIGDYRESDFIIGTHALLYKDDLPEIDLVIIDEQHRFGTAQRHALEKLSSRGKAKAHMLQFSATPIPRTQAMMDSALIDISLITTTPFAKSITTKVISKEDFSTLLSHIKEEIALHHQVLIVYPLVEQSEQIPYQSLEEARGFWEKNFDNVFVTHGKDKEKEEVLLDFREHGDILLATTVVEVGISLPRLTVVIIVGAERLGLATLHQLRGRVGRLGLKSWCYLYTHNKTNERLESFAKTMSGFEIAKLDLQYRNSGDILEGTIQSGQKFRWLDMATDENIVASAKERFSS
ncbi:MAG: ATP-dependent DNA helicase RecG [Sulfurovaceae bacterium]|nr:ATP-dependent DNA helicase RecG [Sulfurovaceae bacterium]